MKERGAGKEFIGDSVGRREWAVSGRRRVGSGGHA